MSEDTSTDDGSVLLWMRFRMNQRRLSEVLARRSLAREERIIPDLEDERSSKIGSYGISSNEEPLA